MPHDYLHRRARSRAASTAYQFRGGIPHEIEGTVGRGTQDVRPRPYRRAANSAYAVLISPQIEDIAQEPPFNIVSMPERAPGYRRAAVDAYQVINGVPVADLSDDPEAYRVSVTSNVRGAPRAGVTAYTILNGVPPQDVAELSGRNAIDTRPRPYRRAANTAYFVSNPVPGDDVVVADDLLTFRQSIDSRPRPYRRAPPSAYDILPPIAIESAAAEFYIPRSTDVSDVALASDEQSDTLRNSVDEADTYPGAPVEQVG